MRRTLTTTLQKRVNELIDAEVRMEKHMIGYYTDADERKEAAEQLDLAKKRYYRALDSIKASFRSVRRTANLP